MQGEGCHILVVVAHFLRVAVALLADLSACVQVRAGGLETVAYALKLSLVRLVPHYGAPVQIHSVVGLVAMDYLAC